MFLRPSSCSPRAIPRLPPAVSDGLWSALVDQGVVQQTPHRARPLGHVPNSHTRSNAKPLGVRKEARLAVGIHRVATLFGGHLFLGPGST